MTYIASVDRYTKLNVEKRFEYILKTYGNQSQKYVLDDILKTMGEETKSNFINTYCGTNPTKTINITYSFPQNYNQFDAGIVINMGAMEEDDTSIGNSFGDFKSRNSKPITETLPIQFDGTDYFVTTSYKVGEIIRSVDLSNIVLKDESHLYQNKIYLKNTVNNAVGVPFEFTYLALIEDDDADTSFGKEIGFNATDTVCIYPISNHMDTLRCLTAIIEFILITMRPTETQDDDFALQKIHREGITVVSSSNIGANVEFPIYTNQFSVDMKTSYSASYNMINKIKEFNFKFKGGN